jgi:hypothetical protein
MTVYGCTISLKAEMLPELKLTGHKYKKKAPLCAVLAYAGTDGQVPLANESYQVFPSI